MSIAEMELGNGRAVVAPRVRLGDGRDQVRLVDWVQTMLSRGIRGEFDLYGMPGSGKSTAMRELACAFCDDDRVSLFDGAEAIKPQTRATELLIYSSDLRVAEMRLELATWGRDDWIEYMLARWRGRCSSVMGRVLKDPFSHWLMGNAQLWAAVLDELAVGEDALDIRSALRRRVARVAPTPQKHAEAAALCVRLLTHQMPELEFKAAFSLQVRDFWGLLRHRSVQLLLASDVLVHWFCDLGDTSALAGRWPPDLLVETAMGLRQRNGMEQVLESVLEANERHLHPVAASLLFAMNPLWRPAPRYVPNLVGARLRKAQWVHVDLFGASLVRCDLQGADLRCARLRNAAAAAVRLAQADLRDALMQGINAEGADLHLANLGRADAEGANFAHAMLEKANLQMTLLRKANLVGANLREAKLRGANLRRARLNNALLQGADFSGADLTKAEFGSAALNETVLGGACLRKASMSGSNLEEVDLTACDLRAADLSKCLLTGAHLAGANLRKADLREAGLAQIDLEGADLRGADLRGASFHLGSTRSGLVGSVIPCEGSKTGFYTDEIEEQCFRRPEEIRKANLSGADLRGAKLKGVDFYLVDVRSAKYSRKQAKYLKRCGAIMT
jgi:uncharacterized protein YjbI with pentapeptide repeats